MSVHCWRASTQHDTGKIANGWCIYIEILGASFEVTIAW